MVKILQDPDPPSCLLLGNVANYILYTHSFSVNCYIVVTQERIIDELSLDMDSTANRLDFVQVFFSYPSGKRTFSFIFFPNQSVAGMLWIFVKKDLPIELL